MRDHDEPAQAEEVGAAVRVGVEALAQPPGGGTDEQSAEVPGRVGGDLLSQRVEQSSDRPLDGLERDVAREAVGDEDVGGALEDVAALGVAAEVEVGRGQQRVRLERELVPLLRLLADREKPHLGPRDAEDLLREDRAHRRELEQVLGAAVGVRTSVDQDGRPFTRGDRDGDRRPAHSRETPDVRRALRRASRPCSRRTRPLRPLRRRRP